MSAQLARKQETASAGDALIAEVRRRLQERFGDMGGASGSTASPSVELSEAHRIGRIVSIEGAKLVVMIEIEDPKAQLDLSHSLQVGCVVKVPTKNSVAFGMVNALSIAKPARNGEAVESRFLELELVGESVAIGTGKGANMRRGVSTYPVPRQRGRMRRPRPTCASCSCATARNRRASAASSRTRTCRRR